MNDLPLLTGRALEDRIASHRGSTVTTALFVAQAELLARKFPEAQYCINLAENRFHFLLGWVAACLRGQITLLPPNQLPATLATMRREFAASHVFDDDVATRLVEAVSPAPELPRWWMPEDRVVAIVFTSGSTGIPQPHRKTWASLYHNSRLAARDVLGGERRSLVATVPSQHMYGLEASLLGALTAGCRIHDHKPFFPADVRAALEAVPAPRTLVTTPAHLKILVAAESSLPRVHRIVSATAPLDVELARRAETLWNTEVVEIFGCTEAGVMAHRRTVDTAPWRTLAGGALLETGGVVQYHAPQLSLPVPMQDQVVVHDDTTFTLSGRASDMIKVAGKRASLQDLTRQLCSVPGVADAAVLAPDASDRPAALVVAPGLDAAGILETLRQTMDPVFVPRPLVVVDKLPRNELGKLPIEAARQLLAAAGFDATIRIAADHPALAGHFPGNPLVPGVVLLDEVLAAIAARRPATPRTFPAVKFLSPVRPEEEIALRVEFAERRARFTGRRGGAIVFEGSLEFDAGESG